MLDAYVRPFRVRGYECDLLGHLNNAVYQHYLEEASIDAWAEADRRRGGSDSGDASWVIRRISLEYLHPARAGDVLEVATWVSGWHASGAQREYQIRGADGELVARSTATWDCVERATGQPHPVPMKFSAPSAADGHSVVKPYPLPAEGLGARAFRWRHQVKRYELDPALEVNSAVYLQWVEEAKFRAAEAAGWPLERMRAEHFVTVQIRHDMEYLLPAVYGDEIEVVSRLYDLRRVRGTWLHEIYRIHSGELLARNYSTGAFLDLEGRLGRAPQAMLEALLRGEPSGAPASGY